MTWLCLSKGQSTCTVLTPSVKARFMSSRNIPSSLGLRKRESRSMERFWFCNYNHLMLFAKTNTVFVGEVWGIKTIYNEETQRTQRHMTITRRHSTVCLSVFDN
ncbi:PREDICTED: uncharacterized protein LOC106304861 [Brassica oleracea var. oleracea]|uniref:uncharacterized protein LOC106304861 n=1 Tax=Brassica oleracea var. oleracea TaxID=109376 RepID=UPI0006A6EE30|nr:PREDICTED: uncharacterized protein LOC106304861 [Brassica oleracea var. oleracea]